MNPLTAAISSKLGQASNYLQGKTVVDNAANPASAYSVKQKAIANMKGGGNNAQVGQMQKNLKKAYANPTGKTYGTNK